MRKARPIRLALCILPILGGLLGCFEGSETGNPTKGVSGILKTPDGKPAANARVTLLPEDFNPLEIVSGKASPAMASTDGRGRFQFTGVDTGSYNVEAVDPVTGARGLIKGVAIAGGMVEIPARTLQAPGRIKAALEIEADAVAGYVFVTGTTLRAKAAPAASEVVLDSVPAGLIDSIQYGRPDGKTPSKAFAWDLHVQSDSVVSVTAPYLTWANTRPFLVNTTGSGAGVEDAVARFPLMVGLNRGNFDFSSAAPDGSDLRFTDGRGKPLACMIQRWDSAQGLAEAWVLADTLFGDSLQTFRLHWGRAGTATLPSRSVFGIVDGYAGVWHLDEEPNRPAPQFLDASERANPATAMGYSAAGGSQAGIAAGSMSLDGSSQFAGTRKSFANPQVFTLSAWFRTTNKSGGKLLDFTDADTSTQTRYRDRHVFMTTNGTLHFSVYPPQNQGQADPNPGIYRTIDSPKPLNDGQWHHLAARLSSAGQDLFVDGIMVASDPGSTQAENITGFWRWGFGALDNWAPPGTGEYFQGALDEIWIAHAARSDAFIKLNFENLKADSRLLQFP